MNTIHKVINKVLMCRPRYFSSIDYVINPWMKPNSINEMVAEKQWDNLKNTYESLGIKVETITHKKGSPDMVFTTDQGIVQGNRVLLSNFRHKERKNESTYYKKWFADHKYKIQKLPKNHYLEGNGETYFWNDIIFVGTGYRSDPEIPKILEKVYLRKVVYLKILDPAFYHLDVGFFPLNNETVFYYPPAYSPGTLKELKRRVPNLIPFSKKEAYGFSANSVVTDHHVIVQKGNPTFVDKLHNLGYKTSEVDVSEFMKSGGGAHCLTNILEETIN